MDWTTIVGLLSGLIIIGLAIGLRVSLLVFYDLASIFITIGGAVCAFVVSTPWDELKLFWKVTWQALKTSPFDQRKIIRDFVRYTEIARRDGILALEGLTEEMTDDFMVRGIQLAVDGTDPELILQTMTTELDNLIERHRKGKVMYEVLGKYLPAFGLVGTLIGLIMMLKSLGGLGGAGGQEAQRLIGEGMAVALLTTFYGAVAANLIALPMADKLEAKSKEEMLVKEMIIRGVMAIQSGDNPRIVEQKLKVFLPPKLREMRETK